MAIVYKTRQDWTSTARGGATLTAANLLGVAVHYPGNPRSYGILTEAQERAVLQGIRNYSVGTKRYADIDYQIAGFASGRVWDLRGITRVPAAHASASNPSANWNFGAFLAVLGNGEAWPPLLVRAFQDWRHRHWLSQWPRATNVRMHAQVPGASTQCAGPHTLSLITDGTLLRAPLASGGVPPATRPGGLDMLAECAMGDKSTAVGTLQRVLRAAGYDPGAIDDDYGSRTADAVRRMRADMHPMVGFGAENGHRFGPAAYTQLLAAVARRHGAGPGPQGPPGPPGRAPDTIAIRAIVVETS